MTTLESACYQIEVQREAPLPMLRRSYITDGVYWYYSDGDDEWRRSAAGTVSIPEVGGPRIQTPLGVAHAIGVITVPRSKLPR